MKIKYKSKACKVRLIHFRALGAFIVSFHNDLHYLANNRILLNFWNLSLSCMYKFHQIILFYFIKATTSIEGKKGKILGHTKQSSSEKGTPLKKRGSIK